MQVTPSLPSSLDGKAAASAVHRVATHNVEDATVFLGGTLQDLFACGHVVKEVLHEDGGAGDGGAGAGTGVNQHAWGADAC